MEWVLLEAYNISSYNIQLDDYPNPEIIDFTLFLLQNVVDIEAHLYTDNFVSLFEMNEDELDFEIQEP